MKRKQIFAFFIAIMALTASSCSSSEDLDELTIEQVQTESGSDNGGNTGSDGGMKPPPPSVD